MSCVNTKMKAGTICSLVALTQHSFVSLSYRNYIYLKGIQWGSLMWWLSCNRESSLKDWWFWLKSSREPLCGAYDMRGVEEIFIMSYVIKPNWKRRLKNIPRLQLYSASQGRWKTPMRSQSYVIGIWKAKLKTMSEGPGGARWHHLDFQSQLQSHKDESVS